MNMRDLDMSRNLETKVSLENKHINLISIPFYVSQAEQATHFQILVHKARMIN